MDEPLAWGVLPWSLFRDSYTTRWSLGASDIIFKNAYVARTPACSYSLFSAFFRKGQTLETFRGQGIFQPALDQALQKLDETRWLHIFPEGAVNLTHTTRMRRFKWGVARLALEAHAMPVMIPIWLTGFDQIMPEHRSAPRWVPRLGARVSVTFGQPISREQLDPYSRLYTQCAHTPGLDVAYALPRLAHTPSEHLYPARPTQLRPQDTPAYATLRSHLAAFLREELAQLGQNTRRRLGQGPGEGELAHRTELIGQAYKTDIPM